MSEYIKMRIPSPKLQALVLGGVGLIFMLIGRFAMGSISAAWTASAAFLLLYIVFSNGVGIFADSFGKYAREAVPSFLGLFVGLGGAAMLISGESIHDRPAFRSIYLVFVLAYFSLMALSFLVRRIADFLRERDEAIHGD